MKKIKKYLILLFMLIISIPLFSEIFELENSISDFNMELSNSKNIILLKENPNLYSTYYNDLKLPVIQITDISDNNNFYPQNLNIIEVEKVLITNNLNLDNSFTTDFTRSIYNNKPLQLGSFGKKRDQAIFTLSSTPFVIENNSLYFVKKVKYELTSFHSFERRDGKNIILQDKINLLIITKSQFSESFEKYKDFKLKQGILTDIAYLEEIYSSTNGINEFEKIRSFIKKEYLEKGISAVLLGGGAEIIPIAKMQPFSYEVILPTDAFYSNLDGEMDGNGNGIYGEVSDNIDVYADVIIGRFPGNSVQDIEATIDKTINYYKGELNSNTGEDFFRSIFLWGFELFDTPVGIQICESIISILPDYLITDSLYENISPNFNFETTLEKFNQGFNVIYAQSHGNINKIGVPGGWGLFSDHAYNLDQFSSL